MAAACVDAWAACSQESRERRRTTKCRNAYVAPLEWAVPLPSVYTFFPFLALRILIIIIDADADANGAINHKLFVSFFVHGPGPCGPRSISMRLGNAS